MVWSCRNMIDVALLKIRKGLFYPGKPAELGRRRGRGETLSTTVGKSKASRTRLRISDLICW